ncbi:DNA-directed RNA polymerase subunit beta [Capsicum baccatum]|uniref:DNA-directed RNA polymerase n=1 Tax=Capsicum baccatum TaxID=33114 RepID=A0A2G2VNF9_CAPBA|nr:DNA-directed RNA polymerase subunit beta [Capsicum baccatum]
MVRGTICGAIRHKLIPTPQNFVTSTPLPTTYESFFSLHPLSQVLDRSNPLTQIVHGRKLSYLGPRGLTGHTASFRIRDIHPSHYGCICPIDTSEGINVGLIGYLAIHARIGHWGSVESPFYEISERSTGVRMLYLSPGPLSCSKKCIVGTRLERQAALDSGDVAIVEREGRVIYTNTDTILLAGFVQCMPNTQSSGQPLLPINLEPQRIGRLEVQRDIERRAAQQEQARLSTLAAAQVHQQNIDNPGRAADPDDEDLADDELLNPRHDAKAVTPANRRDRQAIYCLERRAVQIPFDDDDDDLDGAGATRAIIPPPLAPEAKINITSTMIHLLQLKGLFGGLAGDDPNMHMINFISTCKQLKDAFLERFFPPSKKAQLRDAISNFRQLPNEALHETWERFKKKLMRCPNHHMTNVHLMEILYRALNSVTKPVVDNAAGGSFMDLTFNEASGKTEKVKTVASKGRDESDSEEEANYLNNQGGFRGNAHGKKGRNYYDNSGNKDRDQGSWKNKTDRCDVYIPPGRCDVTASSSKNMSMEDMVAKLLKGVEATSTGVTELINDLSSLKQLVNSHSTSIK